MTELINCSRCKTNKKIEFFKIRNNTGVRLKTCIKCCERCKCDYEGCDKKFATTSKLERHINAVHNNIKDFECDKCNKQFSEECNLDRHIKMVHDKIRDFECGDCDFKCSAKYELDRHINAVHNKIKNFECDKCNKQFSEKGNLDRHIKSVHNKIRDFECGECDFKFSEKNDLYRHIKGVHDKIFNFVCDKCDARFKYQSHLDIHMYHIHNMIKNYGCNICDSKYSDKSALVRHQTICTGKHKFSSGEYQVIKALLDLGFEEGKDYHHNTTFHELTTWCNRPLRFDFRFVNHKIMIEYDGRQHYIPICFGGISQEIANTNFEEQQIKDKLKDEFCKEFGYKMIRISYKDFSKVLEILSGELFDIVNWIG